MKLHQNRGVILGITPADAAHYSEHAVEDEIALVGSAQLSLTITGSVAGMHVRTVYVTPRASLGANYEVAMEALQRCLARTGGDVVHLASRD